VSGWYLYQGGQRRDTDWFHITVPEGDALEIIGDAEYPLNMIEVTVQDCGNLVLGQVVAIGPCNEASMTIVRPAGTLVWFILAPVTFNAPSNPFEFNYVLNLNIGDPIAVESHSWTNVKSLFN
jgi:hypothetical protein